MMMGGFGMLLWLGILGLGVYWLVQNLDRSAPRGRGLRSPEREDPFQILKTRYARGEITREEFEQMKRDLMEGESR